MSEDELQAIEDRLTQLTSRQSLPYAYLTLAADVAALVAEVRQLRGAPSMAYTAPNDLMGFTESSNYAAAAAHSYDDGFVTPPATVQDEPEPPPPAAGGPACHDCGKAAPGHALLFCGGGEWFKNRWTCGHTPTLTCAACIRGNHHMHCPQCGCGESLT